MGTRPPSSSASSPSSNPRLGPPSAVPLRLVKLRLQGLRLRGALLLRPPPLPRPLVWKLLVKRPLAWKLLVLRPRELRPHVLKPLVLRLRDVQQPKQPLLLLLLPPPTLTQPTSLAMEVTTCESRLPTSRLNTNTEDEDYTRPSKECDILPATDQTTDRRLTLLC